MLKMPFALRLPAFLAVSLLIGCQQPSGTPTPFGVNVLAGKNAEALPDALTGGYPMPTGSYVPDELIVQLSDGADSAEALDGFETRATLRLSQRFATLGLPEGMSLSDAYAILASRPGVQSVSLNVIARASDSDSPTSAQRFQEQWAHQVTGLKDYWENEPFQSANAVAVAVLDTGIAPLHPEFTGRLCFGQDFTGETDPDDPTDMAAHGTHVAGTIGAAGKEVAGVAPDVKIVPIKVLGASGSGSMSGIVQGMVYAMGLDPDEEGPRTAIDPEIAEQIRVMNMSLGMPMRGQSLLYRSAIAEATKRGILVVVAAGNDGLDVASPANDPEALSVSSTSPYRLGDRIWEWLSGFSNRGERIDLSAPGGQILSTLPNYPHGEDGSAPTDYGNMSGTSMAAPYVSGVAALVAAKYPPDEIRMGEESYRKAYVEALKQHLYKTADDLGAPGWDPKYGHGRINAKQALTTTFVYPE